MEALVSQLVLGNAPTVLALLFWAHKVDKRLSIIEFHLFKKPAKKE